MGYIKKIRSDFPILNIKHNRYELIYFDNAATTQKPKIVIDSIKEYYETYNSNIHRGLNFLANRSEIEYESTREILKDFINAKHIEEIVFTKNSTESINIVAFSYVVNNLKEGDEIVVTTKEHHSNLLPWIYVSKKYGYKLIYIDNIDDNIESYFSKKTKFVAINHVSNVLGTINDVKMITKISKKYGAKSLIDASQSAPHFLVDVKDIDCDFLVFTGHKMCGPTGTGVLYGKKEILGSMPPHYLGGGMVLDVNKKEYIPAFIPERFEAGTPNIAGIIGLKNAIKYLNTLDKKLIKNHEKRLADYMVKKLSSLPYVKLFNDTNTLPIVSFEMSNIHPHDISEVLSNKGICVRAGKHCAYPLHTLMGSESTVRASLYFYNTLSEIDIFIDTLKEIKELFSG